MTSDASSENALAAELGRRLVEAHLLDDPDPEILPAGDGNINWVRRIRSRRSGRTLVVKHARRALERFPQYHTSTDRIVFERRYFEIAGAEDPERVCPTILHFDDARRFLVLEDLGDAERLDAALGRGASVDGPLETLVRFLGRVHRRTAADPALAERFRNDDIRRLHGDHIFVLPYAANDFPLSDAVASRARALRAEGALGEIAARAYRRYLEPRGALVHGDVQPGNVLLRDDGPTLLDAEIAHVGDPAFDVGTLLAHVWLGPLGRAPEGMRLRTRRLWNAYRDALGSEAGPDVRFADAARYAGLETMRRTIGAARVAAVETDEASLAAIAIATRLISSPPETPEEVPLS